MRIFSSFLFLAACAAQQTAPAAQQTAPPAAAPADPNNILRVETNVVLVDAVVTDKKGNYMRDLKQKDFKVYEDNKEQTIKSFSFEADPASPLNSQPRYLVLFFDNSTMNFGDQAIARKAAALRSYLRYLRRKGVITTDPSATLRTPKGASRLPRVIRSEEAADLLDDIAMTAVDDDVDPSNLADVMWAVATRCERSAA